MATNSSIAQGILNSAPNLVSFLSKVVDTMIVNVLNGVLDSGNPVLQELARQVSLTQKAIILLYIEKDHDGLALVPLPNIIDAMKIYEKMCEVISTGGHSFLVFP